ncbi:unnamed protein product [Rotaria sordida]|uniref:Uncharacterized protein n=1 Tax=Rotaria sordida TaxID=392033 RepID=A0A814NXL7_9BILA|nr:unnamed protein product [Rotaria sordida]
MYKNPNDGNDVDLLSMPGVKQKTSLYVTSLIDIIFTHEELLQLDATKLKFNDGYKLIQEAVRNKFRLSDDIFQIEWCNLHETFLNKSRDIKKGLKSNKLQFKRIHQHIPKTLYIFSTRTCTYQHN